MEHSIAAKNGRLIVFEGVDGSGKTTLAKRLVSDLRALGITAVYDSSPGSHPGTIGALVYRLHHTPTDCDVLVAPTDTSLQIMHAAAHTEAIERRIKPQLADGTWVVLDRWWWSMVVYGEASGVAETILNRLVEIERIVWQPIVPEPVFLIERDTATVVLPDLTARYRTIAKQERPATKVEHLPNNESIKDASDRLLKHLGVRDPRNDREDRIGNEAEPDVSQYAQSRVPLWQN